MDQYSLSLSKEEYIALARLVGHHTTGTKAFDSIYMKVPGEIVSLANVAGPLPTSPNHPYGKRPILFDGPAIVYKGDGL